jgi:hypothetical protein
MADKKFCDWTDLMKGKVGQPEDPLSRPLPSTGPTLKKGEVPYKPSDEEIRKAVLEGAPKQPTDQEMFGRYVVTQEEADKAQKDWNNKFNDFFTAVKKPVELVKADWGRGPMSKEKLTEEEEQIRLIKVNPSSY